MLSDEEILEILRGQNYWFNEFEFSYIPRPSYIREDLITSKAILALKGPRRAGKTVLLKQIISFLLGEGFSKEQVLYVNLEDYRFFNHYELKLLEKILNLYRENVNPDKKCFVLLDEIQNIPGFEKFLRTIYDSGEQVKFVITGSNAKLLSKELGTLLTGRIATIEVFPFSFSEYLVFHRVALDNRSYNFLEHKRAMLLKHFNTYLNNGSIPEFLSEAQPNVRLQEYFENVIYRDIVQRFNIRNVRALKELAIVLATNVSRPFSINKLAKTFNMSVNTLQGYMSDLELSYLYFYMQKYAYSAVEKVTSQSKVYCIDTGLVNAVASKFSKDEGRLLENLVFVELKRRGKEVYYHKGRFECDFVVKEGLKVTEAIQVCASLEGEDKKKRELEALAEALGKYKLQQGLILTTKHFENITFKRFRVKVRPIWFWLLNPNE